METSDIHIPTVEEKSNEGIKMNEQRNGNDGPISQTHCTQNTAPSCRHTLEKIAKEMGSDFDEDKMHTAMLLAYSEAVDKIIRRDCVPSPLYRVIYDEANNNVSMEETHGLSLPPQEGALDISVVDGIFCCNVRDIALLMEGETGVGKTFAAMRYLSTILDKDQYFSHRLSANAFMNNLFSHFQEGSMVKGMPVIKARPDLIESTAACIVDEINRGDSNEALQLFDNEMHLGGKIHKLGVPIPKLEVNKRSDGSVEINYKERGGKKKKLLILCAQNPAGSEDAKFTQTMQLDAAVDNRLLKTFVANAAASAGSTLWLGSAKGKPHDLFLEDLTERVAEYLEIDRSALSTLKEDWLSTYAWLTEAARTDKPILYSSMELADIMTAVFSGNLIDYYNYEKKVIKMWNSSLRKGVELTDDLQETEKVKQIHNVIESFKVPIIFRDIVQIKKISDVLATLKNVKDALKSDDHVDQYLQTKRYVTVREVAGATCLLARNKQMGDAVSPMAAINEVLTQYITLAEEYMVDANYMSAQFNLLDPNSSIKKVAVYKSLRETIKANKGVDFLADKVANQADILASKLSVSEDIKNVLIARSVGDLMTLCGFFQQYKDEIEPLFKRYDKKTKVTTAFKDLREFYLHKRADTAMVMPEIYQHRIQRTLGV